MMLVGLGAAAAVAWAGLDAPSRAFTPPHTRPVAERDAEVLLRSVVLPAGAARLSGEPGASHGALAGEGPREGPDLDMVDRHAWWRIPGSWRTVLAFIRAHPPAGSRQFTAGGSGTGDHETSVFVGFGWPRTVGKRTRQMTVTIAATSGDTSYVRADAHVAWLLSRPASERIPDTVQAIEITRGLPARPPGLAFTVTDPARVRALTTLVNRLPIVQPGQFDGCNTARAIGVVKPQITFTFLAASGTPALAVADEPAEETEPDTCGPMAFSIAGVEQTALLQGPKFVAAAERLLKKKI